MHPPAARLHAAYTGHGLRLDLGNQLLGNLIDSTSGRPVRLIPGHDQTANIVLVAILEISHINAGSLAPTPKKLQIL